MASSLSSKNPSDPLATPGFERIEFHRKGVALLPLSEDPSPGLAVWYPEQGTLAGHFGCSCKKSRKKTCAHILELSDILKKFQKTSKKMDPDDLFRASFWHRLATVLGDKCKISVDKIKLGADEVRGRKRIRILGPNDQDLVHYYSENQDGVRLVQRLLNHSDPDLEFSRARVLTELFLTSLTPQERVMKDRGMKTFRLITEESLWFRIGYHLFRELGAWTPPLFPAVDQKTGEFTATARTEQGDELFRIVIDRNRVEDFIKLIQKALPHQQEWAIHPVPLRSIFHVNLTTTLDLEVRPMIELLQQNGEKTYLDKPDFERFRYKDLVFIPELGIMTRMEKQTGPVRRFKAPERMVLKKSQVPTFLDEYEGELGQDDFILDQAVENLTIFKQYDQVIIEPEAIDRDWCWLDIRYRFGESSVLLSDLLKARDEGRRYLSVPEGWVDIQAQDFEKLDDLTRWTNQDPERLGISLLDLLKLTALDKEMVRIQGKDGQTRPLKRLLELTPARKTGQPRLLKSRLRSYQLLGLSWLRFLFENGLGGLLCDDMGLGKTHQAMALMASLSKAERKAPILVLCPTTVMSHWQDKLKRFLPDRPAAVYHGLGRDLDQLLVDHSIIVTSYGVLRQDVSRLTAEPWTLVVLDEIQNLKNPATLSNQAARQLEAGCLLGLTGTPIENRIQELKALFDLVLPGYLGSDTKFAQKFLNGSPGGESMKNLTKVISPFVMRRTKASVLHELPPKIEDLRACELSQDQAGLYRQTLESRGKPLVASLEQQDKHLSYVHIFSVLALLKQICDHPALISGSWEDYADFESGKWNLFTELMEEILAGDAKVVVYSQFLKMIRIMDHWLTENRVDHVCLTGQTRNRGQMIERFNQDPECRVFVGSLQAGGVGIDLVAASVVIHYDRWWNAAREDQATDRVHRIGQRKGVQVFKLVTLGTLEEKISAIIALKKRLMEDVVREDDPGLLKSFTREELMDLLTFS